MSIDNYNTLATSSTGIFRDRGSKFIAYAFPVSNEENWQAALESVKKEHFKARHHCYAYRLGMDKNNFRANDDGEPSGTAGRPILGQIDSFQLTDVFVVVVRYFGGVKLGTSGLINAYRNATIEALNQAEIIQKTVKSNFKIAFDYALMSKVMNAVKKQDIEITKQVFEETAFLKIAIPKSEVDETIKRLRAAIAEIRLEEIEKVKSIPGLKIEEIL